MGVGISLAELAELAELAVLAGWAEPYPVVTGQDGRILPGYTATG